MSEFGEAFLRQNEDFARGLDEDDRATVDLYAQYHAGNLLVIWRDLTSELSVKSHDDWGGDEGVVVHVYDSEDPDINWIRFFDNGHDALEAFLSVKVDDLSGDEWETY